MEPLTLTEDRIAVIPDAPDETKSGDLIKINAKAKTRGTVFMCGPGVYNALLDKLAPMYVKPGDVIVYARYTGGEIEIDGQTLLLMRQCDVLSIVRKAETSVPPKDVSDALDKDFDDVPSDVAKSGFAANMDSHEPTNSVGSGVVDEDFTAISKHMKVVTDLSIHIPYIPDVIPSPPPVNNVPCTNNACHGSLHYSHECPYNRDDADHGGDS